MKPTLIAILMIVLVIPCLAQSNSTVQQTPASSVWSVHTPDVMVEGRSPYPVGVLTPMQTILIKRVEALSNKGPSLGSWPNGEPIPCPVQYTLELTNGTVTENVPISNAFVGKKTSQTYTDSGPLTIEFKAGDRIVLSLIAPKPQFPPVSCMIMGLDITIQYELAAPKKISQSQEGQQ
ncbi:MAG: hypothetical protein ACM3JB_16195 [Acidobacteriaceae bacterium]